MIEIKNIKSLHIIKSYCLQNNLQYDDSIKMNALMGNDKILEYIFYNKTSEYGEIILISNMSNNLDYQLSLIKAFMFSMDLKGVKIIYIPQSYCKLAAKLGFELEDNKYKLKLEDYNFCNCKNKN